MNFVETTAGLAAATIAGTTGPKINFATFKLGSSYGYTPLASDTNITGSLVYSGAITSALPYNADTMDVVVQLPASAGPFNFGEIALFLGDGTMFCKAAYPQLQAKLSDVANGVGAVWTIHCLIKLTGVAAVFNYTLNTITSIPILAGSAVIGPDAVSATCNAVIALDYTPALDGSSRASSPILLTRRTTTQWGIEGYVERSASFTPSAVSGSPVTGATASIFTAANGGSSLVNKMYIIQSPAGQIVVVDTVNTSTGVITLTRGVTWLNTTDAFILHEIDSLVFTKWTSQVNPQMDGAVAIGTSAFWAKADHVHPTDTSRAPVNSPTFTGVPAAPTAAPGTNTTQLATTAFTTAAISALFAGAHGTSVGSMTIGGIIINWGSVSVPHNGTASVTYDTPFTTPLQYALGAAGGTSQYGVNTFGTNAIVLTQVSDVGAANTIRFIAIGV